MPARRITSPKLLAKRRQLGDLVASIGLDHDLQSYVQGRMAAYLESATLSTNAAEDIAAFYVQAKAAQDKRNAARLENPS